MLAEWARSVSTVEVRRSIGLASGTSGGRLCLRWSALPLNVLCQPSSEFSGLFIRQDEAEPSVPGMPKVQRHSRCARA
jgi:hypothetical protein